MSRPVETCHRCGAVEPAERVYNGTDSDWVQPGCSLRIILSRHCWMAYLCAACTEQGYAKRLLDRLHKAMNAILAEEADHATPAAGPAADRDAASTSLDTPTGPEPASR